jgi:hypothetical protein
MTSVNVRSASCGRFGLRAAMILSAAFASGGAGAAAQRAPQCGESVALRAESGRAERWRASMVRCGAATRLRRIDRRRSELRVHVPEKASQAVVDCVARHLRSPPAA